MLVYNSSESYPSLILTNFCTLTCNFSQTYIKFTESVLLIGAFNFDTKYETTDLK